MKVRNVLRLALAIMVLLLAAGSSVARGPQPPRLSEPAGANTGAAFYGPWIVETVDTWGVGSHASIAISSYSGDTYISYYAHGSGDLKMAKYVRANGNCGTANAWECETVDSGGDVGQYSSIAINPQVDLPLIAYYDATNKALKLARSLGPAGWLIKTVDDRDPGPVGMYASLEVDSDGWPHISYHGNIAPVGNDYWLFYATHSPGSTANCVNNNGDFRCDRIDKATFGGSTSLDMNDAGHIGIIYKNLGELMYAKRTSSSGGNCGPANSGWQCTTIRTAPDWYLSLVLNDEPWQGTHIASYDGSHLHYATPVGYGNGNCGPQDTWQCNQIDTMGLGSHRKDVSMALDSYGFPIIAYHMYMDAGQFVTWGLQVARPVASLGRRSGDCGPQDSWQCDRIPNVGHSGDYLAIAVNPSGRATVAFYNSDYFGSLKVAYQQFKGYMPLLMKN